MDSDSLQIVKIQIAADVIKTLAGLVPTLGNNFTLNTKGVYSAACCYLMTVFTSKPEQPNLDMPPTSFTEALARSSKVD